MRPLVPGMSRPWIVAHRGASASHPENTLAAFDAAHRHPIDAIELDLQRTRDGHPVVFHDRTLGALDQPRRRIAGLTRAQVADLDAGGGEPMPDLFQVLDRFGGHIPLLLEIKLRGGTPSRYRHAALATMVAREVTERGLGAGDAYLLSFGLEPLAAARGVCPELPTIWNLRGPEEFTAVADVDPDAVAALFAVCCAVHTLTPAFVARMHGLGKPVLTYTCNTDRDVAHALAAGADGLIGDDPAWLCAHPALGAAGMDTSAWGETR